MMDRLDELSRSLPLMDTSCCGCSLRAGAFAIGAICTIQGAKMIRIYEDIPGDVRKGSDPEALDVYTDSVILLVSAIINVVMGIVLTLGAFLEMVHLVRAWLSFYCAALFTDLLFIPSETVIGYLNDDFYSALAYFGAGFIEILLWTYMILVVFSYHKELMNQGPRPQRARPVARTPPAPQSSGRASSGSRRKDSRWGGGGGGAARHKGRQRASTSGMFTCEEDPAPYKPEFKRSDMF